MKIESEPETITYTFTREEIEALIKAHLTAKFKFKEDDTFTMRFWMAKNEKFCSVDVS